MEQVMLIIHYITKKSISGGGKGGAKEGSAPGSTMQGAAF